MNIPLCRIRNMNLSPLNNVNRKIAIVAPTPVRLGHPIFSPTCDNHSVFPTNNPTSQFEPWTSAWWPLYSINNFPPLLPFPDYSNLNLYVYRRAFTINCHFYSTICRMSQIEHKHRRSRKTETKHCKIIEHK